MKYRSISRLLALITAIAALLSGCSRTETADSAQQAAVETGAPSDAEPLRIWCFQAGKADAFLLWNSGGAVLIDTGESGFGKEILAKLKELGISRLDALILTHFDKDHVGGAKKLLESVEIGEIYQSNCPKTGADAYEKYLATVKALSLSPVTLREERTLQLGDVQLVINPPAQEAYAEDPSNNSSMIITVVHGENRLLFAGDAEDLRLAEFLAARPEPCGFVKLPHHGRYQQTLVPMLEQLQPTAALITSSEEEPEDEQTLALLAEAGVAVYLTRTAPVLLESDGQKLQITYQASYNTENERKLLCPFRIAEQARELLPFRARPQIRRRSRSDR